MHKAKSILVNVLIFSFTLAVMLLFAEFVFRKLIFSENAAFKGLRDPGFYSDYLNEDTYWKLYYIFGGESKPPDNPHPLLGWVGDFDRNSLIHHNTWLTGNKRPVLLYGDSYAQCVPEAICFQDILNSDSSFSANHYFLNYGVGGFGVDQIQLLFEKTSYYHRDPFVVFSLMVYDIDRTPMTFRTGQKPYYELEHDSLVLKGVPVQSDPDEFMKQNPPEITSYLYRRFLYSDANFLPHSVNGKLKKWDEYTNHKIKLNEAILLETIKTLRERNQDFVFMVFHYLKPGDEEFKIENEDNWRDRFLKEFLAKNNIPYIWSKDIIKKDPAYTGSNYDKYMILENGHPTSYFNRLISEEIKKKLAENEAVRNGDIDFIAAKIKNTPEWMADIKAKAAKRGVSIEESMKTDAVFLVEEMVNSGSLSPGPGYYEMKMKNDSVWQIDISRKAKANNISVSDQQKTEALFSYNFEVDEFRKKNSSMHAFDDRINAIKDSLSGDAVFINAAKSAADSAGYPVNQFIVKKSIEIYNAQLSGRLWP